MEDQTYEPKIQADTFNDELARLQASKFNEQLSGDQVSFAKEMLNNPAKLDTLDNDYAVLRQKLFALMNLQDVEDEWRMNLLFEDIINDYFLFTPHWRQDMDTERQIAMLRLEFKAMLTRGKGGLARERALYHTHVSTSESPQGMPHRPAGFFGKVKSFIRP